LISLLGKIVEVRDLEEDQEVVRRSELWMYEDPVNEELQLVHSFVNTLHVRATYTTLFAHRRDVITWIFTDKDVSQPEEVAVPSANLVVEREGLDQIGDIGLRENATLYQLRAIKLDKP
jgi:hypothetical protein